ncbi:hypothetical protein [Nonomuraea sp. NPDC001699]
MAVWSSPTSDTTCGWRSRSVATWAATFYAGDRLVPTCSDLLADLHRERDRIAQAISDLQTSMDALDDVIAAAPSDVTRRALAALDA